jgi:hypothetical protein
VRLRASTNFFDDSRTVIEYERRFWSELGVGSWE